MTFTWNQYVYIPQAKTTTFTSTSRTTTSTTSTTTTTTTTSTRTSTTTKTTSTKTTTTTSVTSTTNLYTIDISKLEGTLISSSEELDINYWDLKTGYFIKSFKGNLGIDNKLACSEIINLKEDDFLVYSVQDDNIIKVLDIDSNKIVMELIGHSDQVKGLKFLNGNKLASFSWDYTIKIWDLTTAKCLLTFDEHKDVVNSIELTPYGKLVSASDDRFIKVWDLNLGICLLNITGHTDWIDKLKYLEPYKLISSSWDGTVKVWDLKNGNCLKTIKIQNSFVSAIEVTTDNILITGMYDSTIQVWDLNTSMLKSVLMGHSNLINILNVLMDQVLISVSKDKMVKIWNLLDGKCFKTLTGQSNSIVSIKTEVNANLTDIKPLRKFDNILITGSLESINNTINFWNLDNGVLIKTINAGFFAFETIQLLNSSHLVGGLSVKYNPFFEFIQLWDIRQGNNSNFYSLWGEPYGIESNDEYFAVSFDGSETACCQDVMVGLFNKFSKKYLLTWSISTWIKYWNYTKTFLKLSKKGKLITSTYINTIIVWDIKTIRIIKTLKNHTDSISSLELLEYKNSDDKDLLFSGSKDKTIKIWNLNSGQMLQTLSGHSSSVTSLVLANNSYLISGSEDNTIKIWELNLQPNNVIGKFLRTIYGHSAPITVLKISYKNELISVSDSFIKLWNIITGECLRTFNNIQKIGSICTTNEEIFK